MSCPTWCKRNPPSNCAQPKCASCELCLSASRTSAEVEAAAVVYEPTGIDVGCSSCSCAQGRVYVNGDKLYLDSERFFASGLVLSGKTLMEAQTSDRARIEAVLSRSSKLGASSLRWNAILKGHELRWSSDGRLLGLQPGCAQAIRMVADMAAKHGLRLQIVLGTAHWLRFGYGGPDNVLHDLSNRQRVTNIHEMMHTEEGTIAFLDTVVDPIIAALGEHPAVWSFLIFNEGYATVRKADKVLDDETDATISLVELQRWVNRIAGRLRSQLPSMLLSASLKLRLQTPWYDKQGKTSMALWFEDAALITAGGDQLGTLQLHQYQYYPEKAYGVEASPFLNSVAQLRALHHPAGKPVLCGEFPVAGLNAAQGHNPTAMTLAAAYEALWTGGYSGGYTWSADIENRMDAGGRASVALAYEGLARATPPYRTPGYRLLQWSRGGQPVATREEAMEESASARRHAAATKGGRRPKQGGRRGPRYQGIVADTDHEQSPDEAAAGKGDGTAWI